MLIFQLRITSPEYRDMTLWKKPENNKTVIRPIGANDGLMFLTLHSLLTASVVIGRSGYL